MIDETQCPHQSLSALPSVRPGDRQFVQVWQYRLELACSTVEMTHAEAQAHVMIQQRACCVVREGARKPRGGRGKMHYNLDAEWPRGWVPNRFNRYFAVFGLTPEYEARLAEQQKNEEKVAHVALGYGMGKDAFMKAMMQSVTHGLGVVKVGHDEQLPEPVPTPPRPRSEWWQR